MAEYRMGAWMKADLSKAVGRLAEDSKRLDFLDGLNARLNDKYGTTYRWKMTMTHNVNRLALDFPKVDLQDAEADGLKSCRLAIDAEITRISEERIGLVGAK